MNMRTAMIFTIVGQRGDRLRVLHVTPGSPAAAAGWPVGMEICTIDGDPIPALYESRPLERSLTLARFY